MRRRASSDELLTRLAEEWERIPARDRGEIIRRWPDLAAPISWLSARVTVRRDYR